MTFAPEPSEEEVLSRTGLPRWLPWGGGGLLVAVLVAVLALNLGAGGGAPAPTPSQSSASGTIAPPTLAAPPPVDETKIQLPLADPAVDILTTGTVTYALQGKTLVRLSHGRALASVVAGLSVESVGDAELLLDQLADRLWIVVRNEPRAHIYRYRASDLDPLHTTSWPRPISAAAAMDGNLFIADSTRFTRLDPDGQQTPIDLGPHVTAVDIAADPGRSRLVLLVHATGALEVTEIGQIESTSHGARPTGLIKGRVTVTGDGAVWEVGYGLHGAVLTELQPHTLRPIVMASVARDLGPGAELAASGSDVLLVTGASSNSQLYCVAAQTGEVAQTWQLTPDHGTSVHGVAYVTVNGRLERLDLVSHCTG